MSVAGVCITHISLPFIFEMVDVVVGPELLSLALQVVLLAAGGSTLLLFDATSHRVFLRLDPF